MAEEIMRGRHLSSTTINLLVLNEKFDQNSFLGNASSSVDLHEELLNLCLWAFVQNCANVTVTLTAVVGVIRWRPLLRSGSLNGARHRFVPPSNALPREVLLGLVFFASSRCRRKSVVGFMEWICEYLLWDAFIDCGGIRNPPIR
ncbi:hypothetical protein MUK42_33301 [Musa troglodytarum]|uniref:Uncharacterized protein n=1 Tax=Musa troglodytarum TaxID=320322 RepID=A0A9E7F8B5_9LILI|nr:hypothetical protein MUK42_33301 [Musa troglodytarum]